MYVVRMNDVDIFLALELGTFTNIYGPSKAKPMYMYSLQHHNVATSKASSSSSSSASSSNRKKKKTTS